MILREYLYVDTAAVRGVLAQMDSGIDESETETKKSEKKTGGGVKGFAEHTQAWGEDLTTTKSLGDALFPRLESALETQGLLEDMSEIVAGPTAWEKDQMRDAMPPGKIVRITCQGWLMDSRFIASVLTGFATTHRGLVNMGVIGTGTTSQQINLPPKAKTKQGSNVKPYKALPGEDDSLEGQIPLGKLPFGGDDSGSILSGEFLRGITQITRGMFAPGLHLALTPEVDGAGAIVIRLQEGRQFLDSEPDVLFARYGVGAQNWTVVGTVGHHALPSPDMSASSFMEGETIQRAKFAKYVTGLGTTLGNLGFTDLAQAPGFSVVPWAVYRSIGKTDEVTGTIPM